MDFLFQLVVSKFLLVALLGTAHEIHLPITDAGHSLSFECLKEVIHQSKMQNIQFVCLSQSSFCPAEYIAHNSDIAWTSVDDVNATGFKLSRQDFCVISAEDFPIMRTLLATQAWRCNDSNVILTFPTSISPNVTEQEWIFAESWKEGRIDIVIILTDSSDCKVITYIPFKEDDQCEDTSPVMINTWPIFEKSPTRFTYFPEAKISTLRRCSFPLNYNEDDPFFIDASFPFLSFLEKALNLSFRYQPYRLGKRYSLDNVRSGAYVYNFILQPALTETAFAPFFTKQRQEVLVVPNQPISSVQWFRLIRGLSSPVWCAVLVFFGAFAVIFYVYLRSNGDFGSVMMFTLGTCINSPSVPPNASWHFRCYTLLWNWMSFLVASSYLCTLLSQLTVPFEDDRIRTIQDFLETDITISVSPFRKDDDIMREIFANPRYRPLEGKVRYMIDMPLLKKNYDMAYIFGEEYLGVFVGRPYRVLSSEVLLRTAITPLWLAKPSPYERLFWMASIRTYGAGCRALYDRYRETVNFFILLNSEIKESSVENNGPKPLTLKSFAALFLVWVSGCSVSSLVFIYEYVNGFSRKRRSYSSPPTNVPQ